MLQASFGSQHPSSDARKVADWALRSHDNRQAAFIIIDKRAARLYVLDEAGRLRGSTSVLLGAAHGDDTVPGIGQRAISEVRPGERTTPAGRFLAERGHNGRGEDVVWVDYDAGVSIHRVLTSNPGERRLARLASPVLADKRISYGCINVPVAFYETYIRPMFARQPAMVYVLPEVKSVDEVFAMAASPQR
ncbi:MAG TPA: L,D-transpeptidase [Aquabacterium sp.]|uniref:L,D-transpeptidase n=1 Tax=Aquabacterium sp. TaxID=1872578 RepID=UPI002E33BD14|nr:L,D-transpeptidase [Aquabacterium sp.]HEX5357934.1 L,D-transpeptidase [Aquabacterium sp.]